MTLSVKEYLKLEEIHNNHTYEECKFCRTVMKKIREGEMKK